MGTLSGNKLFEIGTDLAQANTQNFSIYDVLNTAYRFYIDPNGQVGLGTSAPDSPLHISKNQNAATLMNISNTSTGTAGRSGVYLGDGAAGTALQLERFSTGFTADATLAGDSMVYSSGAAGMLHLGTAGAKRVTILNSAAWVGIGVDPPTVTLDVNGAIRARASAVSVTGNDAITTADRSHIALTNTSGSNTITLNAPSSVDGQILVLRIAAITAGDISLADSGNVSLSAAWTTPGVGDTLTLIAAGVVWYEIARSNN
jgi:hypothetical protein